MIFGIYINVSTFNFIRQGGSCSRPFINIHSALAMYASYFVLFAHFFYTAYLQSPTKLKGT
jgi:elongation of very long chain fatty acids protein 6